LNILLIMNYIRAFLLVGAVVGVVSLTTHIININKQNVNLQNENLHLTTENTTKDALLNDQITITNAFAKRINKNNDIQNNINKIKYKQTDSLLLNEVNQILNCNLQNFFNTEVVCQK
jgi:hypothetical protein